jgi:hypothetical protein
MGKYTPLADFLTAQDAAEIVMSFSEIERLVGEKLPIEAKTERSWWRGQPANTVAEGWREAGYTPDLVDMEERRLLLRREDPGEFVRGEPPMFGCMKGTVTVMPGVDLTEPADPDWAELAEEKARRWSIS